MKPKRNVEKRIQQTLDVVGQAETLAVQNLNLKSEISKLEAKLALANFNNSTGETVEGKQRLSELGAELEVERGTFLVDISNIQPSAQCRKTILPIHIEKRCQTLLENGQRKSLILIPLKEPGKYEIEDGELTWRAAQSLVGKGNKTWQQLKAVVTTRASRDDANKRSLIHHRHAEHLNNLDYAEGILLELKKEVAIQLSDPEIKQANGVPDLALKNRFKKIIGSLKNKLTRNPEFKQLYEELKSKSSINRILVLEKVSYLNKTEKEVLDFFYRWQEDNISTFYKSVLPLAFMSDYLKKAVRTRGLSCTLALMLDKVKERTIVQKLTKEAIKNNWSKSDLKAELHKLQKPAAPQQSSGQNYARCLKNLEEISASVIETYSSQQKQDLINLLESKLALLKEN